MNSKTDNSNRTLQGVRNGLASMLYWRNRKAWRATDDPRTILDRIFADAEYQIEQIERQLEENIATHHHEWLTESQAARALQIRKADLAASWESLQKDGRAIEINGQKRYRI